jgi:hypothetical protein
MFWIFCYEKNKPQISIFANIAKKKSLTVVNFINTIQRYALPCIYSIGSTYQQKML